MPSRFRLRAAPLLPVLVALGAATATEVEVETDAAPRDLVTFAVAWETAHRFKEAVADLAGLDGPDLECFARILDLVRDHGRELCMYQDACLRVDEAIRRELAATGLLEDFVRFAEPLARHRLEAARAAGDPAALRAVAEGFPGTRAAGWAWQRLADLAWDRGRLDAYIVYAERAGEKRHGRRDGRLTAALELRSSAPLPELPAKLTETAMVWRSTPEPDLPPASPPFPPRARFDFEPRRTGRPALLATGDDELVFAHSARYRRLALVDGSVRGEPRPTGAGLGGRWRLAADDGLCAALSPGADGRLQVALTGPQGRPRWTTHLPLPQTSIVGAPVLAADAVFVLFKYQCRESRSLRLHALELEDGSLRWQSEFGLGDPQTPLVRRSFDGYVYHLPPALLAHKGRLAVLSNDGLWALLDIDGQVQRLWAYREYGSATLYRTTTGRKRRFRPGRLAGTGAWLLAAPSDSTRLLIYDCRRDELTVYAGPGCRDTLWHAHAGEAYLAGLDLTAIDLAGALHRWQVPLPDTGRVAGVVLGREGLLVHHADQLLGFTRADGEESSRLPLPADATVQAVGDLLVIADRDGIEARRTNPASRP